MAVSEKNRNLKQRQPAPSTTLRVPDFGRRQSELLPQHDAMENILPFSPPCSAPHAIKKWLSHCIIRNNGRFKRWKITRAEWKTISIGRADFFANYGNSAGLAKHFSNLMDHQAARRLPILDPWKDRFAGKKFGWYSTTCNP